MRRTPLFIALLLAAAPAAAQQTIHPGQRVTGELSRADSALPDGTYYDVWRFQGEAEHRYRITMRSEDFDAILAVGAVADAECESCVQDDDGGGGFDAEVEFVGREDGTYEIRANSVYEATGRYELLLEDEGVVGHEHGEDGGDDPSGIPIALGETVTGRLERGDAKVDNGYSDTYTYQGRAGEAISVTLRSDDFEGFVTVGAFEGGECTQMDEAHDWSEGGTRLAISIPEDGAYHIHVGAQRARTGSYTLVLERSRFQDGGHAPVPVASGQAVEGELADSDAREAGGAYADVFAYRGRAGETLVIDLESEAFDAFLHFGRAGEGEWEASETDDDGGDEGTASRLTVTLPEDGEYHIHASSFSRGQTGRYTLRVRSQ